MKLPDFRLERYMAQYEFTARYPLCSSDCESVPLGSLLSPESREQFEKVWLGYTEATGHPELRAEIAKLYAGVNPADILVHSGAEEAIFNLMNVLLSSGDHAIIHWPCYQSLFQVAESIGVSIARWESRPEKSWAPSLEDLKSAVQPNTRLVVLNTPHNPTGYLMERPLFEEIVSFLDQRGIALLVDEVYRGLEYAPSDRLPAACDLSPSALSLGVMSKAFGLAGLRIGWLATKNQSLLQKLASFKDYTTICNSAPSEFLAIQALKKKETLLERNRAIIEKNLGELDRFFDRFSDRLQWVRPKAGCIAFPRFKDPKECDLRLRSLVEETGVFLLPGSQFFYPGPHFRIGFGRAQFPEGLARFSSTIG
ncbi:MAG: aminotransferase class I/II-fold pyridoxal phosphate-dependent enzyme [Deltaproteobacteria bacterium]|nr:aminotransferase class I/II-fold pyridoxal phosphate-dependent enzyme [Deltaproteobacteria bacterium]MBI3293329.1 aminotransferase class I/II-fold pyridoxal phosphate-dependent enzyme [Deltaproteobacteria bacterium]